MTNGGTERRSSFIPPFLRRERELPEWSIYDRTLKAYRAWNVKERGAIIDFDLTAGPDYHEEVARGFRQEVTPEDRLYMEDVLEGLIGELDSTQPSSRENEHILEFLKVRVQASLWFLRRLRGDIEGIPYIGKTNGLMPEEIDDSFLVPKRENLLYLAKTHGIPIDSPQEYQSWSIAHQLSPEKTEERLDEAVQLSLGAIGRFIERPADLEYSKVPVREKKYYYAWARTDWKTLKFVLELNFDRSKIWMPGKPEELGSHEGGEHLRRMNDWRNQIRRGKMPAVVGQTIVHGPESVVEEGLALTIAHFVPDIYQGFSPEGKFQVDASILRHMVYGNVSLRLNGPHRPKFKDILDYIHEYIPWEPEKEIRRQIRWRTQDPMLQAYLPSYAFGAKLFLDIIDLLSRRGKKQLLKELSEIPFTPVQLKRRVIDLGRDKRDGKIGSLQQSPWDLAEASS